LSIDVDQRKRKENGVVESVAKNLEKEIIFDCIVSWCGEEVGA
jgi:hypothetical protein